MNMVKVSTLPDLQLILSYKVLILTYNQPYLSKGAVNYCYLRGTTVANRNRDNPCPSQTTICSLCSKLARKMHPRAPVVCLILFSSSFPSLSQLIEWLLKSKTYFKRLIGPPKNLRVTSLSFQNPWSFQDPGSHFGFVNILLSDFCPLSPLSSRFMQILQYR